MFTSSHGAKYCLLCSASVINLSSFISVQNVKLSPEVEPFIPQKKGLDGSLVSMSLSGEAGGGGGGGSGGVESTPIPSYLITCYPFVQENQPNR